MACLGSCRMLQAHARHVQLQDDAAMDQPIDRSGCCDRVLEDALPLRKRLVRTQEDARLLVTIRYQCVAHFHLLTTLLYITKIFDYQCRQLP